MAVLYVTGDALRVVDEISKGLIVDQTIEKVSFCAPDRNHEKGFAYICRDGTTRRWMCHGFLAVKESGERLSHAVGCAFAICLEKKQQREKEKVTVTYNDNGTSFSRLGSFRQATMTERLTDPQSAILAEPIPSKPTSNPYAVKRPHAPVDILERQGSFRSFNKLAESSPFKRNISLRLNELPSNLERQKGFSGSIGPQGGNVISTIMEGEESDPFSIIPAATSSPQSSSVSSSPLHNTFATASTHISNSVQQNAAPYSSNHHVPLQLHSSIFSQPSMMAQQNVMNQPTIMAQPNVMTQPTLINHPTIMNQPAMMNQPNMMNQSNMLTQQPLNQPNMLVQQNVVPQDDVLSQSLFHKNMMNKDISTSLPLNNIFHQAEPIQAPSTSTFCTLASVLSQQQQLQSAKNLQMQLQQKQELEQQQQDQLNAPQHLKQIAADLNTLLNQIKPAVETSKSNNIFGLSNNTSLPITQSNPWATNGTKKPSNQLSEAEQWLNSTASHIDPFAAAPNVLGLKNQQLQQQQQQLLMNQPQQLLAQNLAQQQLLQQQRQLLASLSNSTSLEQPVTGFQTTSPSTTGNDIPLQQPSKSFQNHQPNQQSLSTQLQLLQLQQTLQQQKMQQQQQPQLKQTLQQLQQTLQKQLQQSPTKLLQQSKQQKPFQQPLNNLTLQQQLQQQQLVQIQQQLQQQIQLQELKQLELQLQLQQQQKCKLGGLNQSNNHNSAEDDQSSDDIVLQIQQNQTSLEMNRKQLLSNLQQQLLLSNGSS